MKVSEAKAKLDKLDQDEEVFMDYTTIADIKDIAREQNVTLSDEQIARVMASLNNQNDNSDEFIAYEIRAILNNFDIDE